jgi:hypothetical protein
MCAYPPRQTHTTSILSNLRAFWSGSIEMGHSPLLMLGAQTPLGSHLQTGGYLHFLQAFGLQMLHVRALVHDCLCVLFHILHTGDLCPLAQG